MPKPAKIVTETVVETVVQLPPGAADGPALSTLYVRSTCTDGRWSGPRTSALLLYTGYMADIELAQLGTARRAVADEALTEHRQKVRTIALALCGAVETAEGVVEVALPSDVRLPAARPERKAAQLAPQSLPGAELVDLDVERRRMSVRFATHPAARGCPGLQAGGESRG